MKTKVILFLALLALLSGCAEVQYKYTVYVDDEVFVFVSPDYCENPMKEHYFTVRNPDVICYTNGGYVNFYDVTAFQKERK